jgi:tetratricopeptide (TPR) repeat protein
MTNIKTITQKLETIINKKSFSPTTYHLPPISYLLSHISYFKDHMLSKTIIIFFLFIVGIFLISNILMSQIISPVLLKLVYKNKQATVEYLQQIRFTSFFEQELQTATLTYGKQIKDEVYSEEIQRNNQIKQFEQILSYNPESRDALYSLYQLYLRSGNEQKAEEYLMKAKGVDPTMQ